MSLLRTHIHLPRERMSQDKKSHIFLIDGSGYIFRAFYALPSMSKKDGTPVGAVYGFCRMILRLLQNKEADYIGLVFDAHGPTFRQDIFPQYKANRPPAPPELIPQFPLFRKAAEAFGLVPLEQQGYEADDLIAAYAESATEQNMQVTILSSDKDLMQLVQDNVDMIDPIKNKRIQTPQVIEKFGVPPAQVIDVQALAGDSSDNIPGIPGIGIKTAAQLINEYGDLTTLLNSADSIDKPKRREALLQNRHLAEMSRQLVTLDRNTPLPHALETLIRKPPPQDVATAFFKDMEFGSLLSLIQNSALFTAGASDASNQENRYECLRTAEDLHRWKEMILHDGAFALRLEPRDHSHEPQTIGLSLAVSGGRACYIPLQHTQERTTEPHARERQTNAPPPEKSDLFASPPQAPEPKLTEPPSLTELVENQLSLSQVLEFLKPLLADASLLKIGHDIKYDMRVSALACNSFEDIMLMSFVLSAGSGGHNLEDLAMRHLDLEAPKLPAAKSKKEPGLAATPIEEATAIIAARADMMYRLWEVLKPQLRAEGLWSFYRRNEQPLPPIIAAMETIGIKASPTILRELNDQFLTRLSGLEERIYGLAGRKFNIGSPKQLGELLFDELKLGGGKRTKSGTWSTDSDILENLANEDNPIAAAVVEYRMLAKLISTYTQALEAQIHPKTERIHTQFMLTGAQTGRFSSTDPNLQNIPIRTEEGRQIRKAFIAEKQHSLVSFDYSQIELRIVAEVAEIEALRQAFADDKDIHAMTAAEVFHTPLEQVSAEQRRQAKAINFGIIYGISGFGLARQLGCSRTQAKTFIDRYFARFPGIQDYMEQAKAACREKGFVETLFGRRIHISAIADKNPARRNYAERQAINAPIQGTAADIIKRAMVRMPGALHDSELTQVRMLLQVHDELIFEVPETLIEKAIPVISRTMQQANLPSRPLHVPLKVECGHGDNWFDAH